MKLRDVMGPSKISAHRQMKWIKRFLQVYWLVIACHFVAQWAAFLFLDYDREPSDFYSNVLIWPTVMMMVVVGLAQLMHYAAQRYSFLALFTAGTLIAMVIIHLNMDIRIISALLLLPIFASAIFFRLDLTLFTWALQTGAFFILYRYDYWFSYYISAFDLISVPLFLAVATIVAAIIILNGRELVIDLELTINAKQDLLVENVLMRKLSTTDALTGMYNHITFHEFYAQALEYGDKGAPFHLALVDVDNFKAINDKYGHRTGDLILARVAHVVMDSLSPGDIAARYGGEEFAILLFEKTLEEAYSVAELIRSRMESTPHEEMDGLSVTVSIGLQSYTPGITKEELFEEADELLYRAKRTGKNKVAAAVLKAGESVG